MPQSLELNELDYLGPAAYKTYTNVVRGEPDSVASTIGDSVDSMYDRFNADATPPDFNSTGRPDSVGLDGDVDDVGYVHSVPPDHDPDAVGFLVPIATAGRSDDEAGDGFAPAHRNGGEVGADISTERQERPSRSRKSRSRGV